jgi:hypothetical protein
VWVMLLWQWKNVHKKAIIWGHFAALVCILHLLLGYILFSRCRHGVQHIVLTMHRDVSTIPVTFVRQRLAIRPAMRAVQPTTMTQKKGVPKKSEKKTLMVKPKPPKKKSTKKTAAPQKATPQKKEIKKIVPEKKEPIKKVADPVVVPIALPAPEIPFVAAQLLEVASVESLDVQPGIDAAQAELYALVAQQWAPPVGIAIDRTCEVSVEIGWNQEIIKVWMSKKSGILMYDLAARKAVMQTQFPLWTRGKTVTIQFVQ